MIMRFARRLSRLLDLTQRHPAKAVMALFLLGVAALVVHAKFTEHDRFNAAFEAAIWEWSQVGEHPRPLEPQEREKLIDSLFSREAPDRWRAAGKLASWREPAALWPLIATMQDDTGTGRTCLISQALGKLADPAAVPALIESAQHRSNVDLRVCATHSLGQIGGDGAISFLERRSVDRSVSQGDRTVAISALGEIGSVRAMPVLREIASSETRPMLRSFVASAIRQIELLQGDAATNLLGALGDNSDWIQDDWVLAQLHRRWNGHIAARLNEILRARADTRCTIRIQIMALLSAKQAVEQTTIESLALSDDRQDRWLSSHPKPADVRLAQSNL
jgi:HEAT repeat protein